MVRLASAILATWVVQASATDATKTSLRSPAAELDTTSRRLSYEQIANYSPRSLVTDHVSNDCTQLIRDIS